jgi:hypothetical protein
MRPARRPTVEDREFGIVSFLKRLDEPSEGATVKEIWAGVSEELGDSVTQPAYYKLLDRLTAVGKLEAVASDGGGRRYRVAPHLTAENAITLDDVYELLDTLEPTDAIARVLDARQYFEDRRDATLRRAAEALLEEDPRELVQALVLDRVSALRADLELLRDQDMADRGLEARVETQFRDLHLLVYRYLGLSRAAVDAARADEIIRGNGELAVDPDVLRRELEGRVFGERVIERVDAPGLPEAELLEKAGVSGSDGSTHASVMQLVTAPTYADDVGHQVVTFNNSVVYVHLAPPFQGTFDFPYHSVPLTRTAIDDPTNRGMVLAPFMYRYLSESEYEHMAKCATDVVQWRADEAIFLGTARSLSDGALLPRPMVHFRDGTITPQEREYGHYKRRNEYGDMVREGIARSRKILEKILGGESPPVFAGAVKHTQARFFSMLLNWYIERGSGHRGEAIDPEWDTTRAAHISDNEAMSLLLSTLAESAPAGTYYVTFALARPFHSLTEFFRSPKTADHDWKADFEERLEDEMNRYRRGLDHDPPWLASTADVADDDFVYMCRKADYAQFYVGHTAADPPPIAPRYEFLESLRGMELEAARERVRRNRNLVVAGLRQAGLAADQEHNFMSRKHLVRVIPFVCYEAHEKCKALGRKLESELRSIVIANLQAIRQARQLRVSDAKFLPLTIRRFVERYGQMMETERNQEPGRYEH